MRLARRDAARAARRCGRASPAPRAARPGGRALRRSRAARRSDGVSTSPALAAAERGSDRAARSALSCSMTRRRRVDAAQDGEVERHEVAEQHERDDALDRSARASRDGVLAPGAISSSVSSMRSRMRGCVSESSRNTAEKRPSVGGALPADDLVVVELGQLVREGRDLGVLVDLRLPAVGDRRRQARRRRSTGIVPCSARASVLASAVLGRLRAPLDDELLEVVGGDVDLGGHPRPDAAQRGDLERGDGHVGDGGARLEAARRRGITGTPSARAMLGELAAGRDDDARGAERARPPRSRRASPRCCPSSSRTGRSCPASSTAAGRRRGRRRSAATAWSPSAARASAPPIAEPPMPATTRPAGRVPRLAGSPTRPATARRAGARGSRGRRRAGRTCRPRRSPRGRARAAVWRCSSLAHALSSQRPSELDRAVGELASREDPDAARAARCRAPIVTPSPSTAPPATVRARRRCARPARRCSRADGSPRRSRRR